MSRDRVMFIVTYDDLLVTPEFMAGHLLELEGVEVVKTKEGD